MTDTSTRVGVGRGIFPCRCGQTHTGDYALYDYMHHMCFHDAPLWDLGDGHFCCADCGKDFFVERKPAEVTP